MRRTAFGLDVLTRGELSFLQGATAPPTGRTVELSLCSPPGAPVWPADSELLSEERGPDGELLYDIRQSAGGVYRIAGAAYGSHVLSARARRLECTVRDPADATWQRLLIAQVLPFAAVLQGLEVFHASAVSLAGGAVAFAGPSRSGKTSLALECVGHGAGFLTDDVLAVEPADGVALVHPGSSIAGVERGEAERKRTRSALLESLAENERELLVAITPASQPVPLAAIFFLHRSPDGPSTPRFEPTRDAGVLLTATFNFLLAAPERLTQLLEVCALIARTRVERVHVAPTTDAACLAEAVLERLENQR